jgi:hypothetical protein
MGFWPWVFSNNPGADARDPPGMAWTHEEKTVTIAGMLSSCLP